jgi:hypothetical protein
LISTPRPSSSGGWRDGALAVASEQTTILRILGLTGMDQVLDLHTTVDEPLAAVAPNHEATA